MQTNFQFGPFDSDSDPDADPDFSLWALVIYCSKEQGSEQVFCRLHADTPTRRHPDHEASES
ncbi:MAG: hypothetical protein K9N49_06635 [Candidatus Marinimicrobia bacterium]|nr:hypothetical protein [Candidatus Neomarinimicrobiota bacterium]